MMLALTNRNMAHPLPHDVCLAGLRGGSIDKQKPPLVVERRDQDFVAGLLAALADATQRANLPSTAPAKSNNVMRLFPPVQRVFNCAVLEAFCDMPGQPRLDPAKIDSAGLVVRRVTGATRQAWLKAGTQSFGWEPVDEDADPAFDRRPSAVSLGSPVLDALAPSQQRVRTAGSLRLAGSTQAVSEQIVPLFVAPPATCAAAGKTLLFGHLPVGSDEVVESGPDSPAYGSDPTERALLQQHLVAYLQAGSARQLTSGQTLTGTTIATEDVRAAAQGQSRGAMNAGNYHELDPLMQLLQQLHLEFDAFGDSAASKALMTLLATLGVERDQPILQNGQPATTVLTAPASDFLRAAKAVLLDAQAGATLQMPNRWGAVSAAAADAIFNASLACLNAQYQRLRPAAGRYDAPRAGAEPQYVVRAFVRLKPEAPGCTGRLVWSTYSEPYAIAAWWESSGAPAPMIALPDLFDRGALAKLKPNVAFALPPKLAQLLKADPTDLRDGKGSGDGGLDIGWICSFSLPIITLCAFIVLNIFLQLFNLIFFWLPFLKICIPYPKSK